MTYHHNYWTNVNSRLPSIRFGTGHFYSSCFEENPTSGINSRMGAQVLVEDCYFLDTNDAMYVFLESVNSKEFKKRQSFLSLVFHCRDER